MAKNIKEKKHNNKVEEEKKEYLSKEQFLEMRNHHFKRDIQKKDIENKKLVIENHQLIAQNHELNKFIMKNMLKESQHKMNILKTEYEEFVENMKQETGIDIKGKGIDPITYEVKELEENKGGMNND